MYGNQDVSFSLVKDNAEIYDFPGITENGYRDPLLFQEVLAVSFQDYDGDGQKAVSYTHLEELDNNSLYHVLTQKGIVPERAVESFSAELLTEEDARLLNSQPGTCLLYTSRCV